MQDLFTRRGLIASAFSFPNVRVWLEAQESKIHVESGKIRTAFHYADRWPKPFLHPILSPSGKILSRALPVEAGAHESNDHAWHRGMWIGHGDINGFDFWRELKPENTGVIRVAGKPEISRNGFSVETDLLPPLQQRPIGKLRQQWTFSWRPLGFVTDVQFTYTAAPNNPLRFGDTDDGGFAIRLRDEFREDRGAILLSSGNARGTKALWGKPAKWIDYSAAVEGQTAGVTVYDDSRNLRFPTEWHARPYGLNAANPFAHRSFHGKAAPGGEYEIAAGQEFSLRYRVLWHDQPGESLNLGQEAPR